MSQAPHKCLAKSPRLSVQGLGLNLSAIVVSDPLDSRLSSRSDQIPHRFRPGETSSSSARPAHSFRRAPLFARAQNDQGPEADVPKPQILSEDELRKLGDPERVYRQYGRRFGGGYRIPTDWRESDWIRDAPQVRFRNASDKAKEQLYELAIVNARLAGKEPWEIRQRIEYLRLKRQNWERIYEAVTQQEAERTLASVEDCNLRVDEILSEDYRERKSLAELKAELQKLQQELKVAHGQMHVTQDRLEFNVRKLDELKIEASQLETLRQQKLLERGGSADDVVPVAAATAATADLSAEASASASRAAGTPTRGRLAVPRRRESHRAKPDATAGLEPQLREFWYPIDFSRNLTADMMIPFELFGEPWVLFRDAQGSVGCVRDSCAHRACPLSLGMVSGGQITCAYHGWRHDSAGHVTAMPSTAFCKGVTVDALPCSEADGLIWIYPGDQPAPPILPTNVSEPPRGFDIHAEVVLEVPIEHAVLVQNLLDLAHAPFTHAATFARGWPVPEAAAFKALELLSGHWSPYPIDVSFAPPCMAISTIGLSRPSKVDRGKNHLHQLHVCLPAGAGRTRLLYRLALDFVPWTRGLPVMDSVWKRVAGQILSEDVRLVRGQHRDQQDESGSGSDGTRGTATEERLSDRYSEWRHALQKGEVEAVNAAGRMLQQTDLVVRRS